MTLKQLEAFYWAASCASFALAADRLNISVSSLSKRITELEQHIGGLLFNREGRRAQLSPLGENLLDDAADLLRRADGFVSMAAQRRGAGGRCRLGVGELTSLTWMAAYIKHAQDASPGLIISPQVQLGDVLQQKVANGELDCAIVAGASSSAAIASHLIGQATFTWVASPGVASLRRRWRAADIVAQTIVCLPEGAGTTRLLDQWLNRHALAPVRQMHCDTMGGVAALLQEGLGIGFLPGAWADALIARGKLARLAHAPALPPMAYTFQWRRDDRRPMLRDMRAAAETCIVFDAPSGLT